MLSDLNKEGEHHREHDEGEAEDVEERERHKHLGRCQLLVGVCRVEVDQSVGQEGHHSHLREVEIHGNV